jgi:hypothetical protein
MFEHLPARSNGNPRLYEPRYPSRQRPEVLDMTLGDFHEYLVAAGGLVESNGTECFESSSEGLLYMDSKLLQDHVEKLLDAKNDQAILDFFSPTNTFLVQCVGFSLIRGTLDLLHRKKRHDLLFQVCEQLAKIKPDFLTASGFVSFYSRALNAQQKFSEAVFLLSRESAGRVTPRFPNDIHCVKNLAYALWLLGKNREATEIVELAIARGLPRDQFQHIRFKTSAAGPRAKGRHRQEPRV